MGYVEKLRIMGAASIYDPGLWDSLTPANVLGGKNRAIKASRDILGRYLPDDPIEAIQQINNLPHDHGVAGGLKLLKLKGRDYFKALAKKRWNK